MNFCENLAAFLVVFLVYVMSLADGQTVYRTKPLMRCYQCNVYSKGRPTDCIKDFIPNPEGSITDEVCTACLKTYTLTSIHERFVSDQNSIRHRFRQKMEYESRVCIKDEKHAKREGCYYTNGPNGYQEQCYCYGHLCNAAVVTSISSIITVFSMAASLVLTRILVC